jgi:hypothetical protein
MHIYINIPAHIQIYKITYIYIYYTYQNKHTHTYIYIHTYIMYIHICFIHNHNFICKYICVESVHMWTFTYLLYTFGKMRIHLHTYTQKYNHDFENFLCFAHSYKDIRKVNAWIIVDPHFSTFLKMQCFCYIMFDPLCSYTCDGIARGPHRLSDFLRFPKNVQRVMKIPREKEGGRTNIVCVYI